MGMRLFSSGDGCTQNTPIEETTPNPNPYKFHIVSLYQAQPYLIARINYDGCTTYSGDKILVYEGIESKTFRKLKHIDPHFLEGPDSPIARFPANADGMKDAMTFVQAKLNNI